MPKRLQRAMAAEAEATREARAKVIAAEGEQLASKALKAAHKNMDVDQVYDIFQYLKSFFFFKF